MDVIQHWSCVHVTPAEEEQRDGHGGVGRARGLRGRRPAEDAGAQEHAGGMERRAPVHGDGRPRQGTQVIPLSPSPPSRPPFGSRAAEDVLWRLRSNTSLRCFGRLEPGKSSLPQPTELA